MKIEEIRVREARESDREQLIEMRTLIQAHTEASNPRVWHATAEGRQGFRAEVDEMLVDRDGMVIIAEADEGLVGFTYGRVAHRSSHTPGGFGFINGIYVREHLWRRGIGTRLIRELCRFFKARGVKEANLRFVVGNREGEAFWRRLGFRPVINIANTPLVDLEKRLGEKLLGSN